jgi:imidazolonepropionase-like amidohydrolase
VLTILGPAVILAFTVAVPQGTGQREAVTVLAGVTVVDVERGVHIRNQDVVIQGSRITSVRPTGRANAGARIVRLPGRYVIPALWDMHGHFTIDAWHSSGAAVDSLLRTYFFGLHAAAGVTGVRDLGGDLEMLSRWANQPTGPGPPPPRIVATGQKIGVRPVVPGAPFPVETPEDVSRSVRLLKERGARHAKISSDAPPWMIDASIAACRREGIRCIGHVPHQPDFLSAARAGMAGFEHLFVLADHTSTVPALELARLRRPVMAPTLLERIAWKLGIRPRPDPDVVDLALETHSPAAAAVQFRALAATGAWVTPTLILHDMMLRIEPRHATTRDSTLTIEQPPRGLVRDTRTGAQRARAAVHWETYQAIVRELHAAGVGLLAGTDLIQGIPGFSVHLELELMQRAGLEPIEALRTATLNPARYFGSPDTLGAVAPRRVADLVVLRDDPLADVAALGSIEMVVSRGRVMPRAELDAMVDSARLALRAIRERTGGVAPGATR